MQQSDREYLREVAKWIESLPPKYRKTGHEPYQQCAANLRRIADDNDPTTEIVVMNGHPHHAIT
jgi:hypothetical protein